MGLLPKRQPPKKFSIGHRIYDERKEAIDLKMNEISEVELFERSKSAYRDRMRERIGRTRISERSAMKQNIRIIVIFAVLATVSALALGGYFIVEQYGDDFQEFIAK